MTNVTGSAYQTTNIRSAAKVVDAPSNIVNKMYKDDTFSGSIVMSGGEKWIQLSILNGKPVTGYFVASWVVNSKVTETPPPTDEPAEDDPFVRAELVTASGKVYPYSMSPL